MKKRIFTGLIAVLAMVLSFSCKNLNDSAKINPNGEYGSLVIKQSRSLNLSQITSAKITVIGSNMDPIGPESVALKNGGLSGHRIDNIAIGRNRVVKVETTVEGNTVTIYGYCDIECYEDGHANQVTVNWNTSKVGGVYAALIQNKIDVSDITESTIKSLLTEKGADNVHASNINFDLLASSLTESGKVGVRSEVSGTIIFTGHKAAAGAEITISDPASTKVTGITGTEQTIKGVTPGTWTMTISNNGKVSTKSITVEKVSTVVADAGYVRLGTITVPGVQIDPVYSEKSAVMLQGFTWNSAPRGESWTKENPSPNWFKWYGVMKKNTTAIKDTFGYVWFNPPSICDTSSSEGYAPTELNDLNSYYGSAEELKEVIQAIKPAKAIADIVVNHRAGSTCWGDFTNPDWGVVKGVKYPAICSDDEAFNASSGDKAHMVGKPSGAADTGATYGAYRDIDHTNSTVQQGIIDWMNDVLKPAGFVGWRYDYVKGFGGEYVGKYNKGSSAEFSVGEYWPTAGYNAGNPSSWGNEIKGWITKTEQNGGQRSRAFDFALKGAMNDVFGCTWNGGGSAGSYNYGLLADSSNLYISQPSDAVTFIDNHDTGSNQGHWELNRDSIGVGYALILTHPGVPCVAWSHYFTFAEGGNGNTTYPYSGLQAQQSYLAGNTVAGTSNTLRQHIDYLIKLRKEVGIEYDSERIKKKADRSGYAAEITGTNGSLIVLIGGSYTPSESDYEEVYSGTNFKIWKKGGSGVKTCKTPVISISAGKATITCGTSGATIKYGFSSSAMNSTYTGAVTMSEGQTIYAYATADGMEDSSVVSKTYTAATTYKATSSATWITDDGCVVFAWCWGGGAGEGAWYAGTSDSSGGFTWDAPGDITNFLLARCIKGTTEPDWENKSNTPGRVYNQTDDYAVTSGVTNYAVKWD